MPNPQPRGTRLRPSFRRVAGGLLVAALLAAASCLGGRKELSIGELCRTSDDCLEGLVCSYGRCRTMCVYDRDCPDGQTCVVAGLDPLLMVCTHGDEGVDGATPCPEGLERSEDDGACRYPCDDDLDCGPDQRCVDDLCVQVPTHDVERDADLDDGDAPDDVDADPEAETDVDADVTADVDSDVAADADDAPDADADDAPDADADDVARDADPDGERPDIVATQIAAGGLHSCALLDTGDMRCWGSDGYGQLGYATNENIGDGTIPMPPPNISVGGEVISMSAGSNHTCAALVEGDIRCWGRGALGRLGYGDTNNVVSDPSDVDPVSIGGLAQQVAAGGEHTCVLLEGGQLRCWGNGANGRLGYSDTENIGDDEAPSSMPSVATSGLVSQVDAGLEHTCAVHEMHVSCWGAGARGRLGYGDQEDIGDDEYPAQVGNVSVSGLVSQVSAGGQHTCALLEGGELRCWGYNYFGQLGLGNGTDDIGDDEWPSDVDPISVGGTVIQVGTGANHTCALLDGGTLRCWGYPLHGELGYGNENYIGIDEVPSAVEAISVGGSVVRIAVGMWHTCALLENGDLRCWGYGLSGALGYDNAVVIGDNEVPTDEGVVLYR